MVMVVTWVASQKLESSTARIISMVSPSPERWWATSSEAKPGGRGHRGAEAVAVHALEDDPEQHRAPADEDGRGVEVGDRRPPLQDDAGDEPGGLDDGAGAEQAEGRRPEQLRLPGPGGEDREQRQDVDGHAHVEGLGAVEGGLVVDVGLGVGPGRRR